MTAVRNREAPARIVMNRRTAWLLALMLGLAGCAKDPPPPTIVNVSLSAAQTANATADGAGAPVLVRIYQLGSKVAFDQGEFFRIYKDDAAALGPDLVKKDQLMLRPGASETLPLKPAEAVHAIGVFAAYRDFQNVTWRASAAVPTSQTTNITVTVGRQGIKLDSTPGKPAGS